MSRTVRIAAAPPQVTHGCAMTALSGMRVLGSCATVLERPNKQIRQTKGDEVRAMRSGVAPPQITQGCAMRALSGSQVLRSRKVM